MKNLKAALLVIALFVTGFSDAWAVVQLRLSDGTTTVILTDNGPGDRNPTVGIIVYDGPVGPNWVATTIAGITKPAWGNALVPYMEFSSQAISTKAGKLTIQMSERDFLASGDVTMAIGGNTSGSVTAGAWAGSGNANFSKTTALTSLGPLTPTPPGFSFGANAAGTFSLPGPYSLTLETVTTHLGSGNTGFDAQLQIIPSAHGGCRVTGGSNKQLNSSQLPCVATALPTHISHGGQVGAPFSVETPFNPNSACIWGEWQHNRHLKGNSLIGVLHASGNGNQHQFDSLLCACLPCPENPGAVGVVGEVCNPGDRICGPEPRRAPANKICFSGVGDYTFTTGNKTVKAVFRVDIEDRSEGNSHSSTAPPDRYRIRIWLLDPSCGRNPDPNSAEAMTLRFAASADPATIANLATTENLKVNIAPDIDDGGDMTQGNHQIHPQTGARCNAVAVIAPAHVDATTEIAIRTQGGTSSFGVTAVGLQGVSNPTFVYRTTITNCGWVAVNNLSVITATDGAAVDTTSSYFVAGAVLPPGGTITRYHTNVWSEDTASSISVLGRSVLDGSPAFSSSSTMAVVALGGPTGLSARVAGKKITLSWSALSGASSYNIKRATTSGGPYVTIKTGQTTPSYIDTGLAAGTYYYVVSAVKSGAETLNSTQASGNMR